MGTEACSEIELEVSRRTCGQLVRLRREVEEKLEVSSVGSMDRFDEELTKTKSKDALGVGGPPPQPMSFEDTWDTRSPCRTVQSQSPGKVAFGAHRKSTDYSSDNMRPRTPYGGRLKPQPHQDFDPRAAAPHPHDSMYAANKQGMPFRTDQGGMGNNPKYGFHRGMEDIRGRDRTYMEECTDNLEYLQTYHGPAALTPNFRPRLETRDPMGSLTIPQALKMIPLFDENPDMLATFCQGVRNVLDVFGPSSER